MIMKWVAYDNTGDLIAVADSEHELWCMLKADGWFADEVVTGRWTP